MRLTLICALLLVTMFLVTYWITANIWTATNAAGSIGVAFCIGVAFRTVRIFDLRWQRSLAALMSILLVSGLVAHWIIMWRMTEWQYAQLQSIRRVIYDGTVISTLRTPAYETFREFHQAPSGRTIGEVFRQLYPGGAPPVDSLTAEETGPMFAAVSDSIVRLTGEARFVKGFDSAFVNYDGRHGLAQIQVRVKPEGVFHDIQN